MPTKTQNCVIGTFALLSVSGLVLAQTAPAGSTASTTAASAQIPTQQGQLKQFLLNTRYRRPDPGRRHRGQHPAAPVRATGRHLQAG